MDFVSANPTVVTSIKQRDLLNSWLGPDTPCQKTPALEENQPVRLTIPFGTGDTVTHLIASLKRICQDGGFEIRNPRLDHTPLARPKLRLVVDRGPHHLHDRPPGRIVPGDVVEFI